MVEGCNNGNGFTKDEFKYMKTKMGGRFQSGKLESLHKFEGLSK